MTVFLEILLWMVRAFFVVFLIFGVIHVVGGLYRGE
jgi:hypothetical protein